MKIELDSSQYQKIDKLWQATADLLMAEDDPKFAEFIGGMDKAKQELSKAVNDYESYVPKD